MAERDRYRRDERGSWEDDRRRGGSANPDEYRSRFGENEDRDRDRQFGSGGNYNRSEYERGSQSSDYDSHADRDDYGRGSNIGGDFGRSEFGDDAPRRRGFGSSYGNQDTSGGYGRDRDFSRSDRPDFRRDQRGTYSGLGYGGSGQRRYDDGGYTYGSGQNAGNRGFRSAESDWNRSREFQQNRGQDDDRGFIERAADSVSSWFGGEEKRHHRGRGPKGYTRSEDRMREDVSDKLGDDWMVDATEMEVSVKDGEVTLSGTVNSREEKRRAEDIAETVSGVKHVQNNLRVGAHSAGTAGTNVTGSSSSTFGSGQSKATGSSTNKTGSST
jgi:osmotically-inducible protein OsmY